MNNARPDPTTQTSSSSLRLPAGPSDANDTIVSFPSPSTRQQRLLKLRNDNFPAKSSLSGTALNSRLSGLTADNGSPPPRNQENIVVPHTKGQSRKYHTTSSLGILAEISNTVRSTSLGARDHRNLLGRQGIPIFQDSPDRRGLLEPSPNTSPPYQNTSSSPVDSPFRFENIQDSFAMGLREVSGNARKSPLADDSSWSNGVKSVRRRQTTLTSRFNSDEYIDRIEKELELANNSVYSPNSNRLWKDKLKHAEGENERLRQELADVKATFESEVQTAVQHKTAAEVVLRRKIRALEEEVEQKDTSLRELELQRDNSRPDQGLFDTLKATIERLETDNYSLEQNNQSMSKRIEVLSHLLAFSPTKLQHPLELELPSRLPRSKRPQSLLLPRVASSPSHTHPQRPRSLVGSPSFANSINSSPGLPSPSSPLSPDHHARTLYRPELSRSRSSQLGGRSHSRSSTLASYISQSPTSSDHMSSETNARPTGRRRTRRMNGSTQLKPLLLPTLSSDYNTMNASSPICSPSKIPRRDFTDESVDPTKMFISQSPTAYEPNAEHQFNDPYAALASRATARTLAYQSLEGVLDANECFPAPADGSNDCYFGNMGSTIRGNRHPMSPSARFALQGLRSPQSISSGEEGDRTLMPGHRRAPREEDENGEPGQLVLYSAEVMSGVEVPEPLFSTSMRHALSMAVQSSPVLSAHDDIDNHGLPVLPGYGRKRRKISSSSQTDDQDKLARTARTTAENATASVPDTADKGIDTQSLSGVETPMVRSRPTSLSLLSPRRSRTPLEILQRKNFGVKPIAVVTIRTIYGTLSRCTTLMRDFRKDPLAVARRLIANAWRCNWAVLGKLSWWVLGLFLGPSTRERKQQWDWDDYDGEAIADRHCGEDLHQSREARRPLLNGQEDVSHARRVHFDGDNNYHDTQATSSEAHKKPGWGKTVMLWGKFSMAIMLAVGGAVVKGPGEMLKEADIRAASRRSQPHRQASVSEDDDSVGNTSATSVEMQPVSPSSVTSECRQRRTKKQGLCSSSPSARALLLHELEEDNTASSPPVSSSPPIGSFRFGRGQRFDFTLDEELSLDRDTDTLKPSRPARARIDDIFGDVDVGTPPKKLQREYDPESAGMGLFSTPSTPDSLRDPDLRWDG